MVSLGRRRGSFSIVLWEAMIRGTVERRTRRPVVRTVKAGGREERGGAK